MAGSDESSGSAEERLQQITSVTDAELAHLDFETLLHELLVRVRGLLGVDTATVLLYDRQRERLLATAAVGIEEAVHQGTEVPVDEGFAGTIATTRQPLVVERVDNDSIVHPVWLDKGVRSLLGTPMLANGGLIGVLQVGAFTARRFTDHDVYLLQLAAERVALTTEAETSRSERATVTALHRSLLPAGLPKVAGITLAGRYVPGEGSGVGGDWYDVFTLPTGRIGIVIGDVVGHGLAAAVVMGRVRSALRAYALDTEDPGRVLDKLDRKVTYFETQAMTTVAYAIFDPATSQLRLSLAGHPAPVRAVPGEAATLVDVAVDPPIGFGIARHPRRTSFFEVPPEATVCFYTDGLVERRDSTLDVGLERLCDAVAAGPAEPVCATVMSRLIGAVSVEDDVALLVLSRQTTERDDET